MVRRLLPRRLSHGEEATLVEHLDELRRRLIIALFAVVPAFAVTFAFHGRLVRWLSEPLPEGKELITLSVVEPFTTSVKVAFMAALAIALPVILYQLWAFMAPAIEENTQRVVAAFVAIATALFACGVVFAYVIVLPKALYFLTNFDSELYDQQIRASYYFSFVTLALFALGLAFEMPIFILALVRLQILTTERLRRNRRVGIVAIVALAVLLPTVDPVSLALEVVPLIVLFEASIWLAVLMERRWDRSYEPWAEGGL